MNEKNVIRKVQRRNDLLKQAQDLEHKFGVSKNQSYQLVNCFNKKRFNSYSEADNWSKENDIRFSNENRSWIYQCPICSRFHITTQEQSKPKTFSKIYRIGNQYDRAECSHNLAIRLGISFQNAWNLADCIIKENFGSLNLAQKVANARNESDDRLKGLDRKGFWIAYKCNVCKWWHVSEMQLHRWQIKQRMNREFEYEQRSKE